MKHIKNRPEQYIRRSMLASAVDEDALKDHSPHIDAEPQAFSLVDAVADDRFYFDFTLKPNISQTKK